MRKEDAITTLTWIESSLTELRIEVRQIKTANIYRKPIYDEAREVCNTTVCREIGMVRDNQWAIAHILSVSRPLSKRFESNGV